jgi:hypothetical protein
MIGEPYMFSELNLLQTHVRLQIQPDGTLAGILGGYQDWLKIYYMYGTAGYFWEGMVGIDMPGVYYTLRRLADAYPDPQTHENTRISTAYRIEALPAFVVRPADATLVTTNERAERN